MEDIKYDRPRFRRLQAPEATIHNGDKRAQRDWKDGGNNPPVQVRVQEVEGLPVGKDGRSGRRHACVRSQVPSPDKPRETGSVHGKRAVGLRQPSTVCPSTTTSTAQTTLGSLVISSVHY